MIELYKSKYANFSGRATRREYIAWLLFGILLFLVVTILGYYTNSIRPLRFFNSSILYLILFVPFQAITVRRIRDLGFNGAFIFLNFLPYINLLLILCLIIIKGENKKNAYGDNPYE